MAENDDVEVGGFGVQVERVPVVEDIEVYRSDLDYFGLGQVGCPGGCVHISANGMDGGDFGELIQDIWIADVAGMDDDLDALEGFEGFGAEEAVGVGEDADEMGRRHRVTSKVHAQHGAAEGNF